MEQCSEEEIKKERKIEESVFVYQVHCEELNIQEE